MKKHFFSKKIPLVYSACLLCLTLNGFGQVVQFPTPNAASLGIFGYYPESSFTGVPSIQVPVYNFSYQGLSLPIQLSYNTNLVKPNLAGSWVGLGWNLSAGGSINRVVNGKPDDLNWSNMVDYHETRELAMGYFYNHSYLSTNWTDQTRIHDAVNDVLTYSPRYDLKDNIITGPTDGRMIRDYSPDEFSFTVGDLSGTFYMDDQGAWKVKSNNKVQVITNEGNDFVYATTNPIPGLPPSPAGPGTSPIPLPDHQYLNRIKLIDNRGIIYIFGGAPEAVEYIENYPDVYERFVKTWYLTSIIFPNQKNITFTYATGQTPLTKEPSHFEPLYNNLTGLFSPGPMRYSTQKNHPAYITHIYTDLTDISFYRSENANEYAKLDSIHVYARANNVDTALLKNYAFSYVNSPMDRLKLSVFVEKDKFIPSGPQYSFFYNSTTFLSSATNTNTDHWGYYNTKPVQTTDETSFIQSRNADTASCRAELLDKIVYPMGGYTRYTWEPNDYSKAIDHDNRLNTVIYSTNLNAGGVRIKQITNFDKDGSKTGFKRYMYLKNFSLVTPGNISSGILYSTIKYDFDQAGNYLVIPRQALTEDNVGSHISYSEVSEISTDNSYIKTIYSNFDTGNNNEYLDESPAATFSLTPHSNSVVEFSSNAHERGFPLRQINYLPTDLPVSEKQYTYERVNKANEYVRSYSGTLKNNLYNPGCNCTPLPDWSGSAIKLYTNSYLPSTISDILHTASGDVTKTTNYTYDPVTLNTKAKSASNSQGDIYSSTYNYPSDMVSAGSDPTHVYSSMVAANITSPVIETIGYKNAVQLSKIRTNFYQTFNLFKPISSESQKGTGPSETTLNYKSYDLQGNIATVSETGASNTSYQWGYNNTYPVVKIINAADLQTNYTNVSAPQTSIVELPNGSTTAGTVTILINTQQTVNFTLSPTSFPGDPSKAVIQANYTSLNGGSTGSFELCFGNNVSCFVPTQASISLNPGTYTFSFNYEQTQNLASGMRITINYTQLAPGIKEYYFEGYEESPTAVVGVAHTGHRYSTGGTINWQIPNSRRYVISYWYRSSGVWKFTGEIDYTGSSYVLSGGDAYDDVRINPRDAMMTTYTYDPLIGMTSSTDTNGVTTYYEYDSMARLMNIKDKDGAIIKHIDYNYNR
jgi:hypothetical protein